MRILIDSLSSQVQVQFQGAGTSTTPERRLNTFLGALRSGGTSLVGTVPDAEWQICFSSGPIDATQLDGCDVFLVMTHHTVKWDLTPEQQAVWRWSDDELHAITSFVAAGGGLLLMSNHQPYPQYDAVLAARFGMTVHDVGITNPVKYMQMKDDRLNRDAFGESFLFGVDMIAAHDGCSVSASVPAVEGSTFTWLAAFPPDAYPAPAAGRYFAAHATWGKGQVIFVANSGTVGDFGGNPKPACGMIAAGNNLMFVLNCVRILGGQPQPTKLGACPAGAG